MSSSPAPRQPNVTHSRRVVAFLQDPTPLKLISLRREQLIADRKLTEVMRKQDKLEGLLQNVLEKLTEQNQIMKDKVLSPPSMVAFLDKHAVRLPATIFFGEGVEPDYIVCTNYPLRLHDYDRMTSTNAFGIGSGTLNART